MCVCIGGFALCFFFFSSRRRHTIFDCDWSSDVCSSDLVVPAGPVLLLEGRAVVVLPPARALGHQRAPQLREGLAQPGTQVGERGRARTDLLLVDPELAAGHRGRSGRWLRSVGSSGSSVALSKSPLIPPRPPRSAGTIGSLSARSVV